MGGKPLLPQLFHGIQALAWRARQPVLGIFGLEFERESGNHFLHALNSTPVKCLALPPTSHYGGGVPESEYSETVLYSRLVDLGHPEGMLLNVSGETRAPP